MLYPAKPYPRFILFLISFIFFFRPRLPSLALYPALILLLPSSVPFIFLNFSCSPFLPISLSKFSTQIAPVGVPSLPLTTSPLPAARFPVSLRLIESCVRGLRPSPAPNPDSFHMVSLPSSFPRPISPRSARYQPPNPPPSRPFHLLASSISYPPTFCLFQTAPRPNTRI